MITPASPFNSPLTPNFRLGEFALNRPERRFTAPHQIETALIIADMLEQVRTHFGGPVIITSGHRPWSVNAAVGGFRFSEHLYDAPGKGAVDFYLPHLANVPGLVGVERWLDQKWPHSLGLAAARRGFIHLGMRPGGGRIRWQY
jgi:hypothetical protein